MCGQAGLDLPTLGPEARDGINGILKGFGWAANPADVTGFANSEAFPQIMEHMVMIPGWGRSSWPAPGPTPRLGRSSRSVIGPTRAWCSCGPEAGTPRPASPSSKAPGSRSSTRRTNWPAACRAGSPITPGASAAWPTASPPPRRARAPQDQAIARALGLGRPTLSESESKELLAAWGVASARERRANSAEEAVAAAEQLGFPVALKVDSPDILHKTEAGVVRLNLRDAAQVRTAYAEILANAKAYAPRPGSPACRCRRW